MRPLSPERRRRILEAARDTILERGFEAVSMEDIAKAAGCSKVTLYNYYDTKASLTTVACQWPWPPLLR